MVAGWISSKLTTLLLLVYCILKEKFPLPAPLPRRYQSGMLCVIIAGSDLRKLIKDSGSGLGDTRPLLDLSEDFLTNKQWDCFNQECTDLWTHSVHRRVLNP